MSMDSGCCLLLGVLIGGAAVGCAYDRADYGCMAIGAGLFCIGLLGYVSDMYRMHKELDEEEDEEE